MPEPTLRVVPLSVTTPVAAPPSEASVRVALLKSTAPSATSAAVEESAPPVATDNAAFAATVMLVLATEPVPLMVSAPSFTVVAPV